MTTHLVWFRQDLRLHDNLALAAAHGGSVEGVPGLEVASHDFSELAVDVCELHVTFSYQ